MKKRIVVVGSALILLGATLISVSSVAAVGNGQAPPGEPLSPCNGGKSSQFRLESTIAFTTSRDDPTHVPIIDAAEIYLMNADGTNPQRLTTNENLDAFANLSPDGKRIVFDSDRLSGHGISDLFLMNADGSEPVFLTHGSSATWSPDCKTIAFHASASGTGTPTRTDPGAATTDSDIFVVNVDDLLAGLAQPTNITNSADKVDDDADWSPDGQTIAYTAHHVGDDPASNTAEIYLINADGRGTPRPLTENNYEERSPAWSPDSRQIVFACRTGGGVTVFHLCVKSVDALPTDPPQQLTSSVFGDFPGTFSPDGTKILFHRNFPAAVGGAQLWVMNADGTDQMQLTFPPGRKLFGD